MNCLYVFTCPEDISAGLKKLVNIIIPRFRYAVWGQWGDGGYFRLMICSDCESKVSFGKLAEALIENGVSVVSPDEVWKYYIANTHLRGAKKWLKHITPEM